MISNTKLCRFFFILFVCAPIVLSLLIPTFAQEGNNQKKYSSTLFPDEVILDYTYNTEFSGEPKVFHVLLKRLIIPSLKKHLSRSEILDLMKGKNKGVVIEKYSELKSKDKKLPKADQTMGYFLIKHEHESSKHYLISFISPPAGIYGPSTGSDMSIDIVWHPGKKKIFVVVLFSNGPSHQFELYKFNVNKGLKPLPFQYDSYEDWPTLDQPEKSFKRTTDGHPCSFTGVDIIAEKKGLLLRCHRKKEKCQDQYYRYNFEKETLKEVEVIEKNKTSEKAK